MRERTYACTACWDTGTVNVIDPVVVRDIRAKREAWQGFPYVEERQCTCVSGQRKYPSFPLYHSGLVMTPQAVPCASLSEKRSQFVEAVLAHDAPQDFTSQFG